MFIAHLCIVPDNTSHFKSDKGAQLRRNLHFGWLLYFQVPGFLFLVSLGMGLGCEQIFYIEVFIQNRLNKICMMIDLLKVWPSLQSEVSLPGDIKVIVTDAETQLNLINWLYCINIESKSRLKWKTFRQNGNLLMALRFLPMDGPLIPNPPEQ